MHTYIYIYNSDRAIKQHPSCVFLACRASNGQLLVGEVEQLLRTMDNRPPAPPVGFAGIWQHAVGMQSWTCGNLLAIQNLILQGIITMNSSLHKLEIGAGSPCPAVGLPPCPPHGWNAETPNATNGGVRTLILLDELIEKDADFLPAEVVETTDASVQGPARAAHPAHLGGINATSLHDIELKLNLLDNAVQNHAWTNWNYLQDDLGKLHDSVAAFATRCEAIEESMEGFIKNTDRMNAKIGNLQSFSVTTVPDLFRDMAEMISGKCGGLELSHQLLPQLQQSTATLVRDVFGRLETRIDTLEKMLKSVAAPVKDAHCDMSMCMPTDYVIYNKDMALKDVPFARAVAPTGLGKVDPFKGDFSDDESYCCSDRMPSDDESDAMHGMKHNLSGAGLPGCCTSVDMDDNSRPLITHPWVRAPCAGQHDSHTHDVNMAKGRLQPRKYPHSMHTHNNMHEFSPVREDVSHSSYDSCDEKATR
jgi:hypothetical protein